MNIVIYWQNGSIRVRTVERMQFHLDPQTLKTASMFTHNHNLQTALMGLQLAPTAGPSRALIHSPQSMMW